MQSYTLYNDDVACANFVYANGLIREYRPTMPALLPMQIRSCGAEAFMLWLDTRSIDLNCKAQLKPQGKPRCACLARLHLKPRRFFVPGRWDGGARNNAESAKKRRL